MTHTLQPEGLHQQKLEGSKKRRPEGHTNLRTGRRNPNSFEHDKPRTDRSNKPRKPEGVDQRKPEGSTEQRTTKNKQRRLRQKQNKQIMMNTIGTNENRIRKHTHKPDRRGGGALLTSDRRQRPHQRRKERAQGKWAHDEHTSFGNRNKTEHKLARAWARTPPSGEPGEPRWRQTELRTPSHMPEARKEDDKIYKNPGRNRNYKRGVRSEVATNRRQT